MWAPVRKRFEHLVSAGAVGVTRLAAAFTPPGAEDREDLGARARGDGLVRDMADGANRLAHLLQVGAAAIAGIEMALDERALVRWEHVLQVRGHELDKLTANDLVSGQGMRGGHGCSDTYGSRAARTVDLARWSRTR